MASAPPVDLMEYLRPHIERYLQAMPTPPAQPEVEPGTPLVLGATLPEIGPLGLSASAPGGYSNWMKEIFHDYALGGVAPAAATANLWVALLTGAFTAGTTDIATLQNGIGGTSAGVEVVTGAGANQWNNYQRAQVANNTTTFPVSSGDASTVAATQVAGKHNGIIIGNGAAGAGNNSVLTSGTNAAVTGTGPTPTMWAIVTSATLLTAAVIVAVGPITSGNTPVVNGNTVTMAISALAATIT